MSTIIVNRKMQHTMKKRMTLRQKRAVSGLLFITPWLIGFLVYYLGSLFLTAKFSVSRIDIADTGGYTATYIGFDNFKYALGQHPTYNQVLVNSLVNILIDVPFIIFFSLFVAILLNSRFKGRGLTRAIFFLPILLGAGAITQTLDLATQNIQGGAAGMMADITPSQGVNVDFIIGLFVQLGVPQTLVDYIVGIVSRLFDIVRASSVQIVIFLAALQSISSSLYEVSKIEGATTYETFWKVTFPMVTPLILTNVVYTIIDSFVSSPVVQLAYNTAFAGEYNYGLSSAMSVLSTLIMCLILTVVCIMISKRTFYHN